MINIDVIKNLNEKGIRNLENFKKTIKIIKDSYNKEFLSKKIKPIIYKKLKKNNVFRIESDIFDKNSDLSLLEKNVQKLFNYSQNYVVTMLYKLYFI